MTTLSDRLQYPNLRKIFLLESTAGEHLYHWTLTPAQTYTYETTTSNRIVDVEEDGSSLTERVSIATVEANAGSWWWDQSAGKVYVHPTGSDSPYGYTIQGMAKFFFSTEPRILNDIFYEPRIKSLPNLSLRINDKSFGDVGQIGSGSVVLSNEDGYFDLLSNLQWDAGETVLKLGTDYPLGGMVRTTNLLTMPEEADHADWLGWGMNVTPNANAAPDSTVTMDNLVPTTAFGTHRIQQTHSIPTKHWLRCFAKANGYDWLFFVGAGGWLVGGKAFFNVSSGSVGTLGTNVEETRITDWGGGIYEVAVKYGTASPGSLHQVCVGSADNQQSFSGDGSSGILVWGMGVYASEDYPVYDAVSGWASGDATEAGYLEYENVGNFRIRQWKKSDSDFVMKLEEPKSRLKKKIPVDTYNQTDYTSLRDEDVGKPIPIAYGEIFDATPICIDASTREFKVAGHAIKAFDNVRVYNSTTELWDTVSFASTDLANAEFTLSAGDWDGKAQVSVDFRGKKSGDDLMDNASNIVEDLLTVELGYAAGDLDTTSFSESETKLKVGTDYRGVQFNHRRVAVYLDEQVDALDVFEAINATVGSYLFVDHSGTFRYVVFQPEQGSSATEFDETSIFSIEEDTESQDIISKVRGKYREERTLDRWQSTLVERESAQHLHDEPKAINDEREWLCYREGDANYVTQRTTRMEGDRRKIYKIRVSHVAWNMLLGDQIKITYDRHGINGIFEILELKRYLPAMTVELRVGDLRGLRDEPGFWTENAPTFPSSLGGGSMAAWDKNWTAAQKAYARQNCGFWCDDNGFADSTDPDSYIPSAWV